MAVLHQYDYLFAFAVIFAALDAFNIGANDVANSFATSVSSRSLTMRQAVGIAAVCEFLGAVLVGARVASTIRNGIIDINIFNKDPAMLMLAMVCAITGSSLWLTLATRLSMPVSTTHSIIGAVAGVGIAAGGSGVVKWGWNGSGMAFIFASWVVAPAIAGAFAAVVFLITKYAVLVRKDSVKWGLIFAPVYFFVISSILTMAIIWKGSPSLGLSSLPDGEFVAAVLGTGAVVACLSLIFWLPFVYCRVVRGDYTLQWYMFFLGPLLWWRKTPDDPNALAAVPDYYRGFDGPTGAPDAENANPSHLHENNHRHEKGDESDSADIQEKRSNPDHTQPAPDASRPAIVGLPAIEGAWFEPKNLALIARYHAFPWLKKVLTYGTTVDVVTLQGEGNSDSARRAREMHARAPQYDNRTEHLYSFLQVLTAATASFAHGSNDVSNAIGPFATIYFVWHTGTFTGSKSPVAVWQLAFGGAMIVIGLATYGYNVMKVLGNKLTPHSPSRGMSMELGASIAVILASQFAIPVSTTQCITGATIAVGLCNGDLGALNWKMLGFIWFSWVITIPMTGIISGCLFGIIANAPRFGLAN